MGVPRLHGLSVQKQWNGRERKCKHKTKGKQLEGDGNYTHHPFSQDFFPGLMLRHLAHTIHYHNHHIWGSDHRIYTRPNTSIDAPCEPCV